MEAPGQTAGSVNNVAFSCRRIKVVSVQTRGEPFRTQSSIESFCAPRRNLSQTYFAHFSEGFTNKRALCRFFVRQFTSGVTWFSGYSDTRISQCEALAVQEGLSPVSSVLTDWSRQSHLNNVATLARTLHSMGRNDVSFVLFPTSYNKDRSPGFSSQMEMQRNGNPRCYSEQQL